MSTHNESMLGSELSALPTFEAAWRHCIQSTITTPELTAASQGLLGLLLVGWVFKQVSSAGAQGGDAAALERLLAIRDEHMELAKMVGSINQRTTVQ